MTSGRGVSACSDEELGWIWIRICQNQQHVSEHTYHGAFFPCCVCASCTVGYDPDMRSFDLAMCHWSFMLKHSDNSGYLLIIRA